jgi:probable F420-dependent oxidoreductase
MEIGAAIFFTDYSIEPTALAAALEERGFDSLWVAEHSHIPVTRRFGLPGGMELTKQYFDVMDPFVTLSAAAAVTTHIKLATGVCLVIQRDTIQTAKLVASLDQVSKGRFLFGIGCGWNAEEMEDHGTVYETRTLKMREQIEAMKEIWTKEKPEYHGEIVNFPPMMTWPKPPQKPHPPIIVGGGFPQGARRAANYGDGWMPIGGRGGDVLGMIKPFHEMLKEKGRKPEDAPVTLFGVAPDVEALKRARDAGVDRVVFGVPPEAKDKVLPILDAEAKAAAALR